MASSEAGQERGGDKIDLQRNERLAETEMEGFYQENNIERSLR